MSESGYSVRWLEYACWLLTVACALYLGVVRYQVHTIAQAAEVVTGGSASHVRDTGASTQGILGQMRIPALGLTVPVLDDDDTTSLLHGVGHLRGTAMPGGLGTVALAGHRDTFLRPLQGVRKAMEIDVSRGPKNYRYVVDSTEIVKPEAVEVLATRSTPELVLVTCYPFHYVGAAPLRFIVHAHLVSLLPENPVGQ